MNDFYDSLFLQLASEHGYICEFGGLVNKKTNRTVTYFLSKLIGWWKGGPEIVLNTNSIVPFLNDSDKNSWISATKGLKTSRR